MYIPTTTLAQSPPDYQIAYVEFTSNANTSAVTEGTATSLASLGAQAFDGVSTYQIEMWAPTWAIDTATRDLLVILHDGTSAIGQLFAGRNIGANLANGDFYVRRIFVPAAGSRTYSIRGYVVGGAATASVIAGVGGSAAYLPGFIRLSIVATAR